MAKPYIPTRLAGAAMALVLVQGAPLQAQSYQGADAEPSGSEAEGSSTGSRKNNKMK